MSSVRQSVMNVENLTDKFYEVVSSAAWSELQSAFNDCDDIYVIGHGGNLAIADHAAIDITRLSSGKKNAMCPGSGIVTTSLINDTNFDQWLVDWLRMRTSTRTNEQLKRSLVYGISSSGKSKDVLKALQWGSDQGMKVSIVTGQPLETKIKNLIEVVLGTEYYHTAEVLTLLLQYQLTHGSGRECPPINKNSPQDLEGLNLSSALHSDRNRLDEMNTLAIDFDGPIHKCSLGYHDGTIYDEPVKDVKEALSLLSSKYNIVVHTCKARKDRGLVDGKTGIELVWEWLIKHGLDEYVVKVTSDKPKAVAYIDDKSVRFVDWKSSITELSDLKILF